MLKTILLAAAIAAPLSACHRSVRFDAISYSVDVDDTKGTALFTCKTSSSDRCIFRFDGAGQPASATVATGETMAFTSVAPGSGYCATTGAGGSTCHPQTLRTGNQTIRHQKRSG